MRSYFVTCLGRLWKTSKTLVRVSFFSTEIITRYL